MDLFHCISTQKLEAGEAGGSRAKSEERERDPGAPAAPPRAIRRASTASSPARKLSSSSGNVRTSPSPSKDLKAGAATWSAHYEARKKSSESLEKILTSRTLSPPPETLPRKFSRSPSVTSASAASGRLPRHPELPPLTVEEVDGPRLKAVFFTLIGPQQQIIRVFS